MKCTFSKRAAVTVLLSAGMLSSSVGFATAPAGAAVQTGATGTVPATGAYLGAYVSPSGNGEQTPKSISDMAAQLGEPLGMNRIYDTLATLEPDPTAKYDASQGTIPVISIGSVVAGGTAVPWADVAAGQYDTSIAAQAQGLASLDVPVVVAFDHEPELNTSDGTAADYVAAFDHFVTVFRNNGATNVSFAVILLNTTYSSGAASEWYPGSAYVDWIAADGYNRFDCSQADKQFGYEPFANVFSGLNKFATSEAKPAMVAEWGTGEAPNVPGMKAAWISNIATTLAGWPDMKAVLAFDSPGSNPACGWPLTTSTSATQAFDALPSQPEFVTG